MKRILIALAALAVLTASFAVAASGAESPAAGATGGKITVAGNAAVQSEPDTAEWSFGVSTEADSAVAALQRANAAANRVIAALRSAGVAQRDIRTEGISLSPRTDENGRATDKFAASNTVHVVIRALAQTGRVVDAAVNAGANTMWGPSLSTSKSGELHRQALKAAVAAARVNAQVLADAAGLTLGRVIEVTESGGSQPMPVENTGGAASDSAQSKIEPGRVATYASVSVTFATS